MEWQDHTKFLRRSSYTIASHVDTVVDSCCGFMHNNPIVLQLIHNCNGSKLKVSNVYALK